MVHLQKVTKVKIKSWLLTENIGFEGGQMPLQRRLPKFGFNNINRKEYRAINLDTIQALVDAKNLSEVTKEVLVENGLSSKK